MPLLTREKSTKLDRIWLNKQTKNLNYEKKLHPDCVYLSFQCLLSQKIDPEMRVGINYSRPRESRSRQLSGNEIVFFCIPSIFQLVIKTFTL